MSDIRETKTRKFIVVVNPNPFIHDVKYFSSLNQAKRYRNLLHIFKFNESGIYELKGRGPHHYLYGKVTGY